MPPVRPSISKAFLFALVNLALLSAQSSARSPSKCDVSPWWRGKIIGRSLFTYGVFAAVGVLAMLMSIYLARKRRRKKVPRDLREYYGSWAAVVTDASDRRDFGAAYAAELLSRGINLLLIGDERTRELAVELGKVRTDCGDQGKVEVLGWDDIDGATSGGNSSDADSFDAIESFCAGFDVALGNMAIDGGLGLLIVCTMLDEAVARSSARMQKTELQTAQKERSSKIRDRIISAVRESALRHMTFRNTGAIVTYRRPHINDKLSGFPQAERQEETANISESLLRRPAPLPKGDYHRRRGIDFLSVSVQLTCDDDSMWRKLRLGTRATHSEVIVKTSLGVLGYAEELSWIHVVLFHLERWTRKVWQRS